MAPPVGRLEEFYVTCNPPLLPKGVDRVVQLVREEFAEDVLPEILYEPEAPWFKCISVDYHQEAINAFIQGRLLDILEDETETLDPDQRIAGEVDKDASGDIEVVAENPQVMPWSLYTQREGNLDPSHYDDHRFPVHMTGLAHKTVWRSLEDFENWSLSELFQCVGRLGGVHQHPGSIQHFEELTKCHVSHNLSGTVVYIGNHESMDVVDRAADILDLVLDFLGGQPAGQSHFILTEGQGPFKFCFKWLSHLGLSQLTFARASPQLLEEEYKLLMGGAVLRTEERLRGRWVVDQTTYPLENVELHHPATKSTIFQGCNYPNKTPSVGANPTGAGNIVPARDGAPQHRNGQRAPAEPRPKQGGGAPTSTAGPEPSLEKRLNALDMASTSRARIAKWIEKAGSAGPMMPSCRDTQLISFDAPEQDNGGTEAHEGNVSLGNASSASHDLRSLYPEPLRFGGSDDLICLEEPRDSRLMAQSQATNGNEGSAPVKGHESAVAGMKTPHGSPRIRGKAAITNGHLLDSPVPEPAPPTLLGQHSPGWGKSLSQKYPVIGLGDQVEEDPGDSLAIFGIKEEQPQEHVRTMHQRAGRNGGKQGHNASTTSWRTGKAPKPTGRNLNSAEWPSLQGNPSASASAPGARLTYSAAAIESIPPGPKNASFAKPPPGFPHLKDPAQKTPPTSRNAQVPRQGVPTAAPAAQQTGRNHGDKAHPNAYGIETSSEPGEFVKSAILKQVESRTKALAQVLQVAGGNVSLELRFGRSYFKNMPHYAVTGDSGISVDRDTLVKSLHDLNPRKIGFSPILSAHEADADSLVEIQIPGEPKWKLSSTRIIYEFTCRIGGDVGGACLVEMDSKDFSYTCRGLEHDVASLLLHCPQRAWDMRMSAVRSEALHKQSVYSEFAKSLANSVGIRTNGAGDLTIEATGDARFDATIESVRIRHMARYRNKPTGGSFLTINMYRAVNRDLGPQRKRKGFGGTVPAGQTGDSRSGSPSKWIEASISSVRGQELLKKNLGMQFGDHATWGCEQLESEGVFEDICRPALGMISRMDHIGAANNNGQGFQDLNTSCLRLPQQKDRGDEKEYW